MTSRSATRGNGQLTGSLHRGSTHDYLPQSFQTFASAAFNEPIDANDPTVIQRMSVFLQVYLFWAVTSCAFMGAVFLLFCPGA